MIPLNTWDFSSVRLPLPGRTHLYSNHWMESTCQLNMFPLLDSWGRSLLMLRLRMCGVIPPCPPSVCMAWCLGKHQEHLYLTLSVVFLIWCIEHNTLCICRNTGELLLCYVWGSVFHNSHPLVQNRPNELFELDVSYEIWEVFVLRILYS
jgi:hypothetical protein